MNNLVDTRIDSVFSLVVESSFHLVDIDSSLEHVNKLEIYRKVCLIREYLDQCKVIWAEIESISNS